ncbi:hypothetical protein B0J18DRAFT_441124 [Chaetomium sp. MPI-SDFR-AT-0129]|nr:hypothetical protein B0J18DRAFT_441124 [Chaetomium sp. MPI-SDFR-AT-0129]
MASSAESNKGKVLLTGGTGFIASHVLDILLEEGFDVVVTVRSQEKGQRVVKSVDETVGKKVSFVVVEDIAQDGAFDEAVKSDPPFEYVIHTASPYQTKWEDPVKDCLDPAIKGTTGILKSIHAYAPTVKRVVITSSSAAILKRENHPKSYNESSWSEVTEEQALDGRNTYRASKKFAELAAWDFKAKESPLFDLATINNTYTFGPIPRSLASLNTLNTSNHRIRDLVQGGMREAVPATSPLFTFVDVRDVALAHVRAMAVPEAAGKRFYIVGGFFSNARIAEIVRSNFPDLAAKVLPPKEQVKDDFPEDHWTPDTTRSKTVLGLKYTSLEKTVVDTVASIIKFEGVSA